MLKNFLGFENITHTTHHLLGISRTQFYNYYNYGLHIYPSMHRKVAIREMLSSYKLFAIYPAIHLDIFSIPRIIVYLYLNLVLVKSYQASTYHRLSYHRYSWGWLPSSLSLSIIRFRLLHISHTLKVLVCPVWQVFFLENSFLFRCSYGIS